MSDSSAANSPGWGQIRAGRHYGVVAYDLDRAFALAKFSDHEHPILQYVRERSWGPAWRRKLADPEPVAFVASQFADEIGVPQQRIDEALRRLIKSNVVVRHHDWRISINKNVDEWIHPVSTAQRLNPKQLRYARSAPNTPRSTPAPVAPATIEPTPVDTRSNVYESTNSDTRSNVYESVETHPLIHGQTCISAPQNTRLNVYKPTLMTPKIVDVNPWSTNDLGSPSRAGAPASEKFNSKEYNNADAVAPPFFRIDEPISRRDRIVAMVDGILPPGDGLMSGSSGKIDTFIACYCEDWVETAVLTAMCRPDAAAGIWHYINKCLIRWRAQGGPAPAECNAARKAAATASAPIVYHTSARKPQPLREHP